MENNGNNGTNETKGGKAMSIFQKLYNYRLKIDRKGKTILNWSSLFSLLCLILAPHMTVIGIILSLVLGYHISLETDGGDEEFEQRVRQAADTVRKTATVAARTIREEVGKARSSQQQKATTQFTGAGAVENLQASGNGAPAAANTTASVEVNSAPVMSAPATVAPAGNGTVSFESAGTAPVAPNPAAFSQAATAPAREIPQMNVGTVNQDLLADLEKHADDFRANPATTRTVYSAMAGSVPTLEIHEEERNETPEGPKQMRRG